MYMKKTTYTNFENIKKKAGWWLKTFKSSEAQECDEYNVKFVLVLLTDMFYTEEIQLKWKLVLYSKWVELGDYSTEASFMAMSLSEEFQNHTSEKCQNAVHS